MCQVVKKHQVESTGQFPLSLLLITVKEFANNKRVSFLIFPSKLGFTFHENWKKRSITKQLKIKNDKVIGLWYRGLSARLS